MSKTDLMRKCEELGLKSYKSKTKAQLLELLNNNSTTKNDVNYNIKTMRYLGNKTDHLEFIFETVNECSRLLEINNPVLFDGFGGTGSVTNFFNLNGFIVVSNDMNDYSYKLCYCRNSVTITDLTFESLTLEPSKNTTLADVIQFLNTVTHKGFVYYNYSPNSLLKFERKYVTNENAEKIDGIRKQIQEWYDLQFITNEEYTLLVALLIETVSLYSNIPGNYGAFNHNWDSRSLKSFTLNEKNVEPLLAKNKCITYHCDLHNIIQDVECDILYLDPPYNERDYSSYYHVLETISLYDEPELNDNKTATKKHIIKSTWTNKISCKIELEYIIKHTKAKCIIMSYNNDGFMSIDDIERIMSLYGSYSSKKKLTKRFKCNNKENNEGKDLYEYLHILMKSDIENVENVVEVSNEMSFSVEEEPLDCVNVIHNICCINGMKQLPEYFVDLICTDLPYGLTECKWDTVIDLEQLWEQYLRILKPYGTIILFGQQPFTSRLVSSNYKMFKYSLVWKKSKPGGFAQAPYKVLCEHEDILVFSNAKTSENAKNKMVYNPQGTIPCNKIMKGKTGSTEHRKNRTTQSDYIQTTSNYPRSILEFGNEGKPQHPTQKPKDLISYLIKTFSNEGDIVLDSCMGSGTTAVSCIETNRKYIGYELEEKYYNICLERIKTASNITY